MHESVLCCTRRCSQLAPMLSYADAATFFRAIRSRNRPQCRTTNRVAHGGWSCNRPRRKTPLETSDLKIAHRRGKASVSCIRSQCKKTIHSTGLTKKLGSRARMNRKELERSWKITRSHLATARSFIPEAISTSDEGYSLARYDDWLSHNELELAFDELEGLGGENELGHQFWDALIAAAENMGLDNHANRCRDASDGCRPT